MKGVRSELCWVALFAAGFAGAQELPRYTFNLGTGFVVPVGFRYNRTNIGWNIRDLRMCSVTLDPRIHLTPHVSFDLYITGAGGRSETFTAMPVAFGFRG
jgi:hypothetical protein